MNRQFFIFNIQQIELVIVVREKFEGEIFTELYTSWFPELKKVFFTKCPCGIL